MFEWIHWEFMRHALIAAVLASVACGIVGSFIVVNRMIFLAGGIAHAAYGGVGIGIFFGLPLLPSVIGFAIMCSLILGSITSYNRYRTDALVGVIWATGMSLGALLINLSPGYQPDIMGYLFGSILTITPSDIRIMAFMDAILVGWCTYWYREILAISYDHEFAAVIGIPVRIFYNLVMVLSAVTIVLLMRFVGLILVIALLSIPAYMVERRVSCLGHMYIWCTVISMFFLLTGLITATYLNLPPGPVIILSASLVFCLNEAYTHIINQRKR